jgi:hypothetical protein
MKGNPATFPKDQKAIEVFGGPTIERQGVSLGVSIALGAESDLRDCGCAYATSDHAEHEHDEVSAAS